MGGWKHICWPMRFEPARADPLDIRTEAGELFWPELFPEETMGQLERDLGPYGAAGQLQQRPAPEGGGWFECGWFEIVDAAPVDAQRCRGWDGRIQARQPAPAPESPWYRDYLRLVGDQNTKTRMANTAGGWRIATFGAIAPAIRATAWKTTSTPTRCSAGWTTTSGSRRR